MEEELSSRSVKITNPEIVGQTLRDLTNDNALPILFGRISKGNEITLANWDTILHQDDVIMLIGGMDDLNKATTLFGEETEDNISYNRKEYDVRRIFVSNPRVVGRTISSLNLSQKYDVPAENIVAHPWVANKNINEATGFTEEIIDYVESNTTTNC